MGYAFDLCFFQRRKPPEGAKIITNKKNSEVPSIITFFKLVFSQDMSSIFEII